MSRWFRHYAGMMRDEKLVSAAVKSKQPVERVVWVWGAILESASEIDDAGRYELDPAEVAYFLRADEADVVAVIEALAAANRVADGFVVKWGDRQYQSDKSAERQARYRERKQGKDRDGDVPAVTGDGNIASRDGVVTAQETEADTDTDTERKSPPNPQGGGMGDLFGKLVEAMPINPSSKLDRAEKWFLRQPDAAQCAIVAAGVSFAAWFWPEQRRKGRSEAEALGFAPALHSWLSEGGWKSVSEIPSAQVVEPMVKLDRERDEALWLACEAVMGKKAPTSDGTWSFRKSVVEQARGSIAQAGAA